MIVRLLKSGYVIATSRRVTMTFRAKGTMLSDRRKFVDGVLHRFNLERCNKWEGDQATFRARK